MFEHDKKPEIVAPGGDVGALIAAAAHGADAVYFGLKECTARMRAGNFTFAEARDALEYLHAKGKKGYLALNILFKNNEIRRLIDVLAEISCAGFDGVIIQDIGLYRLIRTYFPSLPLHASTQMACYTLDGARQLEDMGFKRIVLSRELSLEDIRSIREGTRVEVEVFIHGALCYCFSGLCLFSSHIGGRSGNRGQCAQPCRKLYRFAAGGGKRYLFSTNDMCLADYIAELRRIGVHALKIEGRMKGPHYAGSVSSFYRKLVDADRSAVLVPKDDLKLFYSRDFVEDYFGERGAEITRLECPSHIGLLIGRVAAYGRGRITFRPCRDIEVRDGIQLFRGTKLLGEFSIQDLAAAGKKSYRSVAGTVVSLQCPVFAARGDSVYLVSSQKMKQRYALTKIDKIIGRSKLPVDIDISVAGPVMEVHVASGTVRETYRYDIPATVSREEGLTAEIARAYFARLGTTDFRLRGFKARIPAGIYISPAALNDVRRETIRRCGEAIRAERKALARSVCDAVEKDLSCTGAVGGADMRWSVKIDRAEYLDMIPADRCERIYLDITSFKGQAVRTEAMEKYKHMLVLSMPLLRAGGIDYVKLMEEYACEGFTHWQAQNIGDIHAFRKRGLRWHADYPLYCLNRVAGKQLADMGALTLTASPEDDRENLCGNRALAGGGRGEVIVYQDTPLFVSRMCVYKYARGCGTPARCAFDDAEVEVVNDEGDRFLAINRRCTTVMIRREPYAISQYVSDVRRAGITRCRIDFCYRRYDRPRIADVCAAAFAERCVGESHSGNYLKSLQ